MNIRNYWIELIQNIAEMQELASTEDAELALLRDEIAKVLDDQFIETARESGIARWEKVLSIQPFADDTLASRRFRIRSKWANLLPYTYRQLENRIEQIVGVGGYEITLDASTYTLTVLVNLGNARALLDTKQIVDGMVPANLIVTVDLRYNRHQDLTRFTHGGLSALTHYEIKEEVLP